jgi:hypothetical protein
VNWPLPHDDAEDMVKEESVSHQLSVSLSVTSLSSRRPERSAFTRRVTDEQCNCGVLNTCCS